MDTLPWMPLTLSATTSVAAMPSDEATTPPIPTPMRGEHAVKHRIKKKARLILFSILFSFMKE
jgi:hypothetical protein